jgi:hypothetical protein
MPVGGSPSSYSVSHKSKCMCIPSGLYSYAQLCWHAVSRSTPYLYSVPCWPPHLMSCAVLCCPLQPDSEKLQKVLDAAQPQIQRVLSI